MSKKGEGEAAAAPVKGYLVKNALLSVRMSTDPRAAEYEQFVEGAAGEGMEKLLYAVLAYLPVAAPLGHADDVVEEKPWSPI